VILLKGREGKKPEYGVHEQKTLPMPPYKKPEKKEKFSSTMGISIGFTGFALIVIFALIVLWLVRRRARDLVTPFYQSPVIAPTPPMSPSAMQTPMWYEAGVNDAGQELYTY
jgi:hypothetical protein